MRYATSYDVGARKRGHGINEDSVAVLAFEDGHRDGYRGPPAERAEPTAAADPGGGADAEPEDPVLAELRGGADRPERDRPADATRGAGVVVLADGAGGHDAGDVASYVATTRVAEELAPVAVRSARADPGAFGVDIGVEGEPPGDEDYQAAVAAAVEAAHRGVLDYAAETGTAAYTTVVAGLLVDGRLHYGWVGDSRAYVCNARHDHLARLTRDHGVVEELRASGEIDDVEAHVHPRGNELTRALGGPADAEESVSVATASVSLFAEDRLLLTSDGLVDAQSDAARLYDEYLESGREEAVGERVRERVVTDDEIREWLLGADSVETAADTLVEAANERGGKDNLSVVVCADESLPATPNPLPVRDRSPHPAHAEDTVVE